MRNFFIFIFLTAISLLNSQSGDPVAAYTFNDGTCKDERGHSNARSQGVSYVEDRFGNPHSACFMHGNPGSYLNLGTDSFLKPEKGTLSLWVNIDIPIFSGRGRTINSIILTKSQGSDDFFEAYSLAYDFEDKKIVGATTNSEFEQLTLHSAKEFSLHKWHHLVLTYDNNFSCLYLDGKLEIKMAKNFRTHFLETDSVVVGTTANLKNNRFLCGAVDDINIYNRVISPEEVIALYETPNPNRYHIYLMWIVSVISLMLFMASLIWLILRMQKQKFEKEKQANLINSKLLELETKAVRSQMNPHFIFNSLNTLLRFILQEDFANSHVYLTKFSVLLRKLLETSSAESIALTEEMEILKLYLEIEKLRFSGVFEFEITSDVPNPDKTFIPFMLVQPFVENAIWHGLLHKTGDCFLSIRFSDVDSLHFQCSIEDNGVGRSVSKKSSSSLDKKSMGIDLVIQRLALLNNFTGLKSNLLITDKTDPLTGLSLGTKVDLLIPKLNT